MNIWAAHTKKMNRIIQVHDLLGICGCWPHMHFAFSRRFLFSISMGLAFCIDETINELIMTNDQATVHARLLAQLMQLLFFFVWHF